MCEELNRRQKKSILIACVLGDGHLKKSTSSLSISHCEKQLEYLLYKKELIEKILQCKSIKVYNVKPNVYNTVCYSFEKGHKYFRILRKWIYKNNVKTYSKHILSYLDAQGIAIWYMDDGTLSTKKRNGKIHAYELFISTSLSLEENQQIVEYFKDNWNIIFTVVKNRGRYRLRMGTKEIRKFMNIVRSFIVPCMQYKLLD